jgi:ClpX C4-type zinc finger
MSVATDQLIASCSFCLKPDTEVGRLVAGPGVYICNECVALCAQLIADTPAGPVPRRALWDWDMAQEDVLALLPRVVAAGAQVEANLAQLVRKARSLGATWARVGEALGMTRQSAWERFAAEE